MSGEIPGESVIGRETREMREQFIEGEYGVITGKSERGKTFSNKDRKIKIRMMLGELFDARIRISNLEVSRRELITENDYLSSNYQRMRQEVDDNEEVRTLIQKLQREKWEKKKAEEEALFNESLDSDDEEDEYVSVEGIKYLIVEDSVVDMRTGSQVGNMKDGKVLFNGSGTRTHKKYVRRAKLNEKKK